MTTDYATCDAARTGDTTRMRVALLVTDLQHGGTPLRIARTARALRAAGVECVVGCLATRGPVSDELERDGFPTFACDAVSSRPLRALSQLRMHMRAARPDLIHATLTHANVAARIVGRQLKIPVVTATATIEVERPWHLRLERWTARCDAGHIVQSESVRAHVIRTMGRRADRVFVVPPNIERLQPLDRAAARRALAIADDQFLIAWAGRFDPVKRIGRLVEIAAIAPDNWRFVLAGDGPDHGAIQQQIAALSLADRIRLCGWIADLGELFSAADVMVFPSRTEGVPNALLQAMSLGVPGVVSDIAPHREIADNGGVIRVTSDDPAAWRDAVARLVSDPHARKSLTSAAIQNASRYLDPAVTAATLIELYKSILAAQPPRRAP